MKHDSIPDEARLDGLPELALALGGGWSSFTGHLLQLCAKADPGNRNRLRLGFARQVRAFELWQQLAPNLTAGQLNRMLDDDILAQGPQAAIAAVWPWPPELQSRDV